MKRIVFSLLALALTLVATQQAVANGDPVATFSALGLARTPVAVHIPEVQLVDELVEITPTGWHTTVKVTYKLKNNSTKAFKHLPYGFPIDWYGKDGKRWEGEDAYSESVHEVGWRDDYVRDVLFTLDGRKLAHACSRDTLLQAGRELLTPEEMAADTSEESSLWEERYFELFDGDSALFDGWYWQYVSNLYRRWYYAYLDIPAGATVTLVITYAVANEVEVPLYGSKYPFNRLRGSWCNFAYDFSPAAYWGNGKAQNFKTLLDTKRIEVFNDWSDLNFERSNTDTNLYGFTAKDFDLATAEPLRLQFLFRYREDNTDFILKHRIPADRYTIEVSGVDKGYPAANLSDKNLATAAVLRAGAGDSIYITIRFKKPTPLGAIVFYNGYGKSLEAWRNNSRVDSMLVTARFETEKETQILFYGSAIFNKKNMSWDCFPGAMDAREPEDFTWRGLTETALCQTLYLGPIDMDENEEYEEDYGAPTVTELHFSITAVKKGLKYNDLCISEIVLLGD